MYFSILHFTRQVLQRRVKSELEKHPYYGSSGNEPIHVAARAGFVFKKFPAVLVHTPTGEDTPLDIGQFMMEVEGHVQVASDAYFFTEAYQTPDDPTYAVTYTDETYTLEVIGTGATLKVTVASTSTSTEYSISPDELRTDIVPGVSIRFASMNNITVGATATIKTYEESQVVADLYGGRWPLTCTINALTRRSLQAEEIGDLVLSLLVLGRQDFLESDGIQARAVTIAGENDDLEDFGDEVYGHTFNMEFSLEWRAQVAVDIFTGWNLVVPVSPDDPAFGEYTVTGGSERE